MKTRTSTSAMGFIAGIIGFALMVLAAAVQGAERPPQAPPVEGRKAIPLQAPPVERIAAVEVAAPVPFVVRSVGSYSRVESSSSHSSRSLTQTTTALPVDTIRSGRVEPVLIETRTFTGVRLTGPSGGIRTNCPPGQT